MGNVLQSPYLSKAIFLVSFWMILTPQILSNANAAISCVTQEGQAENSSYFFYQRTEYPRDCAEILHQCSNLQNKSGVYLIKPDGISEPFEVYCDNDADSGGWTMINRRNDGSMNFNRNWNNYLNGFGFLNTEFWLGNEKLSYLVNQKKYELRIDVTFSGGSSCDMTYKDFRISDEWGDYGLVSVGTYSGSAGSFISWCPTNMKYGNCSCQATCEDPQNEDGCNNACADGETCFCPEGFLLSGSDCIREQKCGCFLEEAGVIKDGQSYITSGCSRNCTCHNNHLTCEDNECSADSTCQLVEGAHQCRCNEGFVGDGKKCDVEARSDCLDLFNSGVTTNGVYTIRPEGWPSPGFEVYCDMESNGGGWTVFQRRVDGTVEFYRGWTSYKDGFGNLAHEFWLGNDKIHKITNQRNYQLRIDAVNSAGTSIYSLYRTFSIGNEANKYRLNYSGKSGNTGGDLLDYSNGDPFSTYDQDNDDSSTYNCAEKSRGAWWYDYYYFDYYYYSNYCFKWRVGSYYYQCSSGNLNGDYNESGIRGIVFWDSNTHLHCGITRSEMKIRPL